MDSGHNCEDTKQRSEKYDAYYCFECNVWLEDICSDRDCVYCKTRPLKPNEQETNTNSL
jgi:hypothetical protein